jgi:two-component system chemotaxis sensor kinase CheA
LDSFEVELKTGFLDEAQQGVSDVEQCFLALESNPGDEDNLNRIFRLAHNLKGSSKAVGFDELGHLTHEFETFILKVKNKELEPSKRVVNLFLRVNDFILTMIGGLRADFSATFGSESLIEEMKNFSAADDTSIAASGPATVQPVAEAAHESSADVAAAIPEENQIGQARPVKKPAAAQGDDSIRVALSKVEMLVNFVGELVILQSVMREQILASGSPLQRKTMQQMEKVSKEIQDLAMGLRMIPVKPTFMKMQRIVRDTAVALEKEVGIELHGEETEIDKTILEKLNDPLVHLIRNSVDHGIEKAEARAAAGKPTKGLVKLQASHRAGKLLIEVIDDGGGLDPEKLKAKAVEKGLLKPDAVLSENEAFNLIFAPGFSTKEKVTDVSGRGVGMDVVKTNIQDLGGEVQIESKVGIGTTFRVVLPLTLAIVESMIVNASGHKFVIPMNHVHENLQPSEKSIQRDQGVEDVLMLRNENLPLLRLGDFFGLKSDRKPEEMIAMVMRDGPSPFALLVDDILGQFQVVVKQLGPEAQGSRGVSGVTILGDGKPALILEPGELIKRKLTSSEVSRRTA